MFLLCWYFTLKDRHSGMTLAKWLCQAATSRECELTNIACRLHMFHGASKCPAAIWRTFSPQPKLVLIYPPLKNERLSWPEYMRELLTQGYFASKMWHRWDLNLLSAIRQSNMLTTQPPHLTISTRLFSFVCSILLTAVDRQYLLKKYVLGVLIWYKLFSV